MQATAELFVHVMLVKSHRRKRLSQNPEFFSLNPPKLLLKRQLLKHLRGLLLLLLLLLRLGSLQMHRHSLKRCVMDSSVNLRRQRELEKLLNQSEVGFLSYRFHRRPPTRTHDPMIKWCNRTWRHRNGLRGADYQPLPKWFSRDVFSCLSSGNALKGQRRRRVQPRAVPSRDI